MKKILILTFGLLFFSNGFSQDFEKGDNVVTLGFGFDPYYNTGGNGFYSGGRRSSIGPIVLTYERGITDVLGIGRIGVGGGIAQSWYHYKWESGNHRYKETDSRTGVLMRGAYHFEFGVDKMDVYAGVGAAVYVHVEKEVDEEPGGKVKETHSTRIRGGHYVFGGIRYFFTDAFGVYAEVGHGIAAINGGLVFKF